jgi:hypothetical protein
LLSTLPAQRSDLGDALFTALVLFTVFCATAPFAQLQLEPVTAFIPIYESALVVTDLITAALLFGQISMRRSAGLPFLAAGYLFTALLAIAHLASFPGLFSPTGLLGAGPQTTAWLYMFWHAGFPLLVVVYARLERTRDGAEAPRLARLSVKSIVALVIALACAATLLTTVGQSALPQIMPQHEQRHGAQDPHGRHDQDHHRRVAVAVAYELRQAARAAQADRPRRRRQGIRRGGRPRRHPPGARAARRRARGGQRIRS